ncbi:glucagon-like peptide 2 receptor [Bombina bombina]|uniref:glucagon-like peptide 2 receptor n=1 Tax=Bombina bombina TaxID=8345 RepID=UPI00235A5BE4|nr:glucagon-like peptide 2 receptor [Bombina bombina]
MGPLYNMRDNSTLHFLKRRRYQPVIILIMLLPLKQVRGSVLEDTLKMWSQYKDECLEKLERERSSITGVYCNGTFDQYACWPHSPPGNISVPCPWYLPWVQSGNMGYVYRYCSDKGIWQKIENSTDIWRDHSECSENNHFKQNEKERALLSILQICYTVGYSISLATLILALLVLLICRRLHCTRNFIHVNLFASMIMKALTVIVKDVALHNTYSRRYNDEMGWMSFLKPEVVATCRASQVLMHFFTGANYFWLLVEGIYLYTILVTVVLSEKGLLKRYLVIGWLFPVLFVTPWVVARICLENIGCWGMHEDSRIWWIIRGPMLLCVFINFFIFLKILKLLQSKLKAQQMKFTDYKCRLTRATLVLIPLLGIHDVAFSFFTDEQVEGIYKHIRLFLQLTLSSFQGFLVATLYCFANGEVRAELRKQWDLFQLHYVPCQNFFSNKVKYQTKSSKQQKSKLFAGNGLYQEVKRPSSVQLLQVTVNVTADLSPQPNVPVQYFARGSVSESSDGGLTLGETIEETLESEI